MNLVRNFTLQGMRSFRMLQKIAFGMTKHEIILYTVRLRSDMEQLFILITAGDLIGLPVLPPYYTLRLLPYFVPQLSTWKRQMLRERDFLEADGLDLLG
jgi:hypothetical protein